MTANLLKSNRLQRRCEMGLGTGNRKMFCGGWKRNDTVEEYDPIYTEQTDRQMMDDRDRYR